jgi:hypothetical protein
MSVEPLPDTIPATRALGSLPKARVLLLEWGVSHSEFLHAQIRFLNAQGVEVHLWIHQGTKFVPQPDYTIAKTTYLDGNSAWARLKVSLQIRRYLTKERIGFLLINTAHGLFARDLSLLLLGHPVIVTGICHFAQKLGQGMTQRLISVKVKKYFVLHPYMQRWAQVRDDIRLTTFYYIFFVPKEKMGLPVLPKVGEELRIVVPGALEHRRRDYFSLVELAKAGKVPANVKFVLLGNYQHTEHGRAVAHAIKEGGVEKFFVLFDHYVSDEVFFEEIAKSAAVLPLLHPHLEYWTEFTKYSISGSYNLAFAFHKPILCVREPFEQYEIFEDVGLFYEPEYLDLLLAEIAHDPSAILEPKIGAYAALTQLTFRHQAEHYTQFVLAQR